MKTRILKVASFMIVLLLMSATLSVDIPKKSSGKSLEIISHVKADMPVWRDCGYGYLVFCGYWLGMPTYPLFEGPYYT